jgi:hypothetical protein
MKTQCAPSLGRDARLAGWLARCAAVYYRAACWRGDGCFDCKVAFSRNGLMSGLGRKRTCAYARPRAEQSITVCFRRSVHRNSVARPRERACPTAPAERPWTPPLASPRACQESGGSRAACREIDFHVLDAGVESFRWDCCKIGHAKVAADLIIEIHRCHLIYEHRSGKSAARSAHAYVAYWWKADIRYLQPIRVRPSNRAIAPSGLPR